MPSTSKSQQRLFGWALSCKRGESKDCPANIQKIADSMSEAELEKFASTSHEGLPDKVKESLEEIFALYNEICEAEVAESEKLDEGKAIKIEQPKGKGLAAAKQTPASKAGKVETKLPPAVDNKSDEKDSTPGVPPGIEKAGEKPLSRFTPNLFKLPMEKGKHERRVFDFDQFLKIINYKTHDGIVQKGHGQNLSGGNAT